MFFCRWKQPPLFPLNVVNLKGNLSSKMAWTKIGLVNLDSLLNAEYPSKSLNSKLMLGILHKTQRIDGIGIFTVIVPAHEICTSVYLICMRSQFLDPQKLRLVASKGGPFPVAIALSWFGKSTKTSEDASFLTVTLPKSNIAPEHGGFE